MWSVQPVHVSHPFPLLPAVRAQAFRRGGQFRRPLLLRVPLPGRAVGSEDSLSSPTSSFVLAPAFTLGDRSTGRESLLQQIAQAFVTARPKRAVPASSRLNALRSAFDSSSWHECVNPAKAMACCDCVRRCSSAGQAPDKRSTPDCSTRTSSALGFKSMFWSTELSSTCRVCAKCSKRACDRGLRPMATS